ncbi:MAG: hypothetical protein NT118_00090 [Lentisphaerae bacterium]|nr:hypothetical protein [Lentisphaerota bacterium]
MDNNLNIEVCPETGICSIMKKDGTKVDLMPDEVRDLRVASGNPDSAKQVLAQVDSGFAESLSPDELKQLAARLK